MVSEPVVLFTSCDENYVKYIPTLLMSAHKYMSAYPIEFYLLHSNISTTHIDRLLKFCHKIKIQFHTVRIDGEDLVQYKNLHQLVSGNLRFPVEAYFDILPNLHFPPYVSRALYLDAGDVILSGDISKFYFSDFKGNILTVSKGFAGRWDYTAEDLYERQYYLQIASEYLNSGSVLFNVALMRQLKIDFEYYASLAKQMKYVHGGFDWNGTAFGSSILHCVAFADQGLLAIAFSGYINFFDPDNLGNINTPYNFRPFVIEVHKQQIPNVAQLTLNSLQPKIIHLLGNKPHTPPQKRKNLLKISQQSLQLWDQLEQQAQRIMEGLE